jgi:Radical SAM superfamily
VGAPLLLIPPLTQLNTPYPATAYISGFLKQQGYNTRQGDLGLDMVLEVFHRQGLQDLFDAIEIQFPQLNAPFNGIILNRKLYENTIDDVISFLQNKNYTLAYRMAAGRFLPEGNRFKQVQDLDWYFGNIGVQDKARYFCTLYLEDLADLIQATVGPHFGFSKYAERISRTAVSFSPIEQALKADLNYFDAILIRCLARYFEKEVPSWVGFTVPFGGNLYGALKAGQWIKSNYPQVKIIMGGGYPNTELRELRDPRVFQYLDYITLDDGEGPLLQIIKQLELPEEEKTFKRTFRIKSGDVVFENSPLVTDFAHAQKPAPTYSGMRLSEYLSVIDMPNPMHRLWNDGRWNKLTVAHGCYWKKCSFCDISLDYIGRYEKTTASHFVDQMEALIEETGENGFHFVDEAAPPAALKEISIEILKRKLQVSWWANIRFEKSFDPDLCALLADAGCIAVTGGLEVASPRILEMIDKGISIDQVAKTCHAFVQSGILVHAYLMFGFPTQTAQETIDSLEVVRQLFQHQLLQSGHWHQFAMTVHSPVGKDPEKYGVTRIGPVFEGFANNDLYHEDLQGAPHEQFSDGLKKALYNYMHGLAMDFPLKRFFSFPVPETRVPKTLIEKSIRKEPLDELERPGHVFYFYHTQIQLGKQKGGDKEVVIYHRKGMDILEIPLHVAQYLFEHRKKFDWIENGGVAYHEIIKDLSSLSKKNPEELVHQRWWKSLRRFMRVIRK